MHRAFGSDVLACTQCGGRLRLIVTLGERGVLACREGGAAQFPAFPVQVVDTTAAGDAFNDALAVGLAAGGTLDQAIPLANAAAALACTKRAAQDSLPVRADLIGPGPPGPGRLLRTGRSSAVVRPLSA